MTAATSRIVDTNGARLFVDRRGTGPAVLMIQGVGVPGCGWRPQADGLSDRFTVITFDNRGIGRSTRTSRDLSIPTMAADARAVLDALDVDRAHVVGHSMGGVIACELALSAPHRVRSLALLCTFARGRQATAMTPALLWAGLRTRIGTRAMRRAAFLELVMPHAALAGVDRQAFAAALAPIFGHDLADQPPIAMAQLGAMRRYDRAADFARLSGIPSLVLSASDDRIAKPAYGRELAAAIPGSHYVEITDAGHGVPIHRADDVNSRLAAFWLAS